MKTAQQLRQAVEEAGNCPFFFEPKTMRFFGDTMSNYGVRPGPTIDGRNTWELYRRRAVKHGLISSTYFYGDTFEKAHIRRNEELEPCAI